MMTSGENQTIRELIAARRNGHGMPREFYGDELIYRADIARLWRRGWLFAGHTCQIAEPGDYFTFDIDSDSLLVVRDDDGSINAFHNLCRHRGTLLCEEASGKVSRFVCPYSSFSQRVKKRCHVRQFTEPGIPGTVG